MKYIKFRVTNELGSRDYPVIFPDGLSHVDVAAQLKNCPELQGAEVLSAGFCNIYCSATHGKSVSLGGMKAKSSDASLINGIDYSHGIVMD